MVTVSTRTRTPAVRKNFGEKVFYTIAGRLYLYKARVRKAMKLADQHPLNKQ